MYPAVLKMKMSSGICFVSKVVSSRVCQVADLVMKRQQGGDAERISREHEDQRARMEAFSKLGALDVSQIVFVGTLFGSGISMDFWFGSVFLNLSCAGWLEFKHVQKLLWSTHGVLSTRLPRKNRGLVVKRWSWMAECHKNQKKTSRDRKQKTVRGRRRTGQIMGPIMDLLIFLSWKSSQLTTTMPDMPGCHLFWPILAQNFLGLPGWRHLCCMAFCCSETGAVPDDYEMMSIGKPEVSRDSEARSLCQSQIGFPS